MARILIIHSGLNGILNASFELARKIQLRGDECTLSSPKDVSTIVSANGFDFLLLEPTNFDPAPEVPQFSGLFRKLKRLSFKIAHKKERKNQGIESLGMLTFLEKMRSFQPDKVIIDVELHEHIMTLVSNGFNVTLLSQWFSIWKRNGLPPIVTDIIPGQGFSGSKLGIWFSWTSVRLKRWWMFAKKNLSSVGTDRRSILLAYADSIGFSRNYIKENNWPGPFVYDNLPVISMTDEDLEFPHNKRPNLKYIGAMVYENRADIHCSEQLRREMDELIRTIKSEGKKLIYCSVSTFKAGDQSFISKVIKALNGLDNWVMIIGLGGQMQSTFELPSNVFSYEYVPQLQVLKEADLSINHGGIHTINECLHFNVPMLIYSGKRSDQDGCAARMHYHGKGIMADKDIDSPLDIREKITKLLKGS